MDWQRRRAKHKWISLYSYCCSSRHCITEEVSQRRWVRVPLESLCFFLSLVKGRATWHLSNTTSPIQSSVERLSDFTYPPLYCVTVTDCVALFGRWSLVSPFVNRNKTKNEWNGTAFCMQPVHLLALCPTKDTIFVWEIHYTSKVSK